MNALTPEEKRQIHVLAPFVKEGLADGKGLAEAIEYGFLRLSNLCSEMARMENDRSRRLASVLCEQVYEAGRLHGALGK